MRETGGACDDCIRPFPRSLIRDKGQLLSHPIGLDFGRGLARGDASSISLSDHVSISLDPDDRIEQVSGLSATGADTFHDHQPRSRVNRDASGTPALVPRRWAKCSPMPLPQRIEHATSEQVRPVEAGVKPCHVVGMDHGRVLNGARDSPGECRLPARAAAIHGQYERSLTDAARSWNHVRDQLRDPDHAPRPECRLLTVWSYSLCGWRVTARVSPHVPERQDGLSAYGPTRRLASR